MLLVVGLLCGGLVSLLLLNVVLSQDSFEATELRKENDRIQLLKERETQRHAIADTPENLSNRAKSQNLQPDDSINVITPGKRAASTDETRNGTVAEDTDR
ncbi:hypothetical protein [Streptosporangium sp. KLBMP 9127]